MGMFTKISAMAVALVAGALSAGLPKPALAAIGDITVQTTTTCSGSMCVETTVIFEEVLGGYRIISTTSRTFRRLPVAQ